jgi:hypothetical protein
MNQSKFEELTNLMASKAVPHYAFELLADLRSSERDAVKRAEKAEAEIEHWKEMINMWSLDLQSESEHPVVIGKMMHEELMVIGNKAEGREVE